MFAGWCIDLVINQGRCTILTSSLIMLCCSEFFCHVLERSTYLAIMCSTVLMIKSVRFILPEYSKQYGNLKKNIFKKQMRVTC